MSGQVTDAMVERAARAICGAFGLKPDGKALHFTECDKEPLVENWRHYVQQARAAIEAASPQPQGADTHKCFECGEELVTLCLACNPLAQAAHPQPQGAECKICKGSGMTGWEKPMGNPPTMVFVPQRCQCEAGQKLFNSASPQPQGADGINAGSVETPGSTLGLSAEACQRSGAAGFDSLTSENLGEYKYQEPSNASVLGSITHPQPSGDGLSEETLREMLVNEASLVGLGGMRYATARELDIFDRLTVAALKFARAVEARVRSAPTDEWRRAVEACAGVVERLASEATMSCAIALYEAADEIRALSPTKPDAPPYTKEGE